MYVRQFLSCTVFLRLQTRVEFIQPVDLICITFGINWGVLEKYILFPNNFPHVDCRAAVAVASARVFHVSGGIYFPYQHGWFPQYRRVPVLIHPRKNAYQTIFRINNF